MGPDPIGPSIIGAPSGPPIAGKGSDRPAAAEPPGASRHRDEIRPIAERTTMADDTREEYLRGADTDAARGGGASTDRGGRDTGMPGPSGEAAGQAADTQRSSQETDRDGPKRGSVADATATVTDPGPTS
jgi:hypothetical protein